MGMTWDEILASSNNTLIKMLEQKTQMIDKSNFDIEQYKIDLQTAYECGYAKGKNDNATTVEAIPKADYENRLKADMVAMLTELQLEIREHDPGCGWEGYADKNVIDCIIQERINSLKGE